MYLSCLKVHLSKNLDQSMFLFNVCHHNFERFGIQNRFHALTILVWFCCYYRHF